MRALRLACINSEAAPLFNLSVDGGATRTGYEPDIAAAIVSRLRARLEWVVLPWDDMIPAVLSGRADAVLCGQGIIPARQDLVDFSRPYAVFNESVLVRAGDPARSPDDLAGYRVAAIEGSANMLLAESFPQVEIVPFASSADVFGDMIEAVRSGSVDAMVDDDVVTVPLGDEPEFDLAFTVETRNQWGIGVSKVRGDLLEEIDGALSDTICSGEAATIWTHWMPQLPVPSELIGGSSDHK